MEFGIFNLMGSRDPEKPTAEVFAEVAEQTRLNWARGTSKRRDLRTNTADRHSAIAGKM